MKLTYEDKVQIYELRKQGVSYARLADTFGINARNLVYMIKLIDRYGIEIAKKVKNRYCFPKLKIESGQDNNLIRKYWYIGSK